MFTAEVFAGSSLVWFLDGWGLLVTLPLYLVHLLFYYNVAYRTQRDSLAHMYFWGMLLALYEAPITKVLWAGYPGNGLPNGTILGVGWFEFLTLVFFWHPIFAFIVPISIFKVLTYQNGSVLPNYVEEFVHLSRWIKVVSAVFVLTQSSFSTLSSGFNIATQLLAAGGSFVLIVLIYRIGRNRISEENLVLGRIGMTVLVFYLIALYLFGFTQIRKDAIPSTLLPYLSILIIAIVILFLIFKFVEWPIDEEVDEIVMEEMKRRLRLMGILFILMGIIFGILVVLTQVVFVLDIILLPVFGVIILIVVLFKSREK